ncbi:MAG: hypothetical protein KME57_27340 [Scytonema hyalinum WJT4-NPBG1]|jgi:hypothetical protein|nr:hypothetical protein [Scytonema hyalinum WJT4-NPBG1]
MKAAIRQGRLHSLPSPKLTFEAFEKNSGFEETTCQGHIFKYFYLAELSNTQLQYLQSPYSNANI